MSKVDPRPTADVPDDDPYLWLEEIDSPRALDWVSRQNASTLDRFTDDDLVADRRLLKSILDHSDNIPFPNRRGAMLFNPWTDDKHPRGLWRRTKFESFCRDDPAWETLIDLDKLAFEEKEDWVWRGADTLVPDHELAIIRLSRGGSDAVVLREFDLRTRRLVSDGFYLPEAKSTSAWLDLDTLLLCSSFGNDVATKSGSPRTVRLWRRGQDPLQAKVLFETLDRAGEVSATVDQHGADERIVFKERRGLNVEHTWIGDRTGPHVKLDVLPDSRVHINRDWLAIRLRSAAWTTNGDIFAPDTVLGVRLSAFIRGARNFTVLFMPQGGRALQDIFWCGKRLVLSSLRDLSPVFEILTPSDEMWSRQRIDGMPEFGSARAWPLDLYSEESNGDLLASSYDRLNPSTLYLLKPDCAPQLLKRAPRTFNSEGLRTTRHEATSVDGVKIPYIQVGPKDEKGEAPVHLYGYGGFGISQSSYYNCALGKLWLERGGTSVITHLRGGREFGAAWYEAGRREGRRRAHDDFAAVASDLVSRGVTIPRRIVAEGGSNGGLLIANMLTRYPENFGAFFCTTPIIDMRRYTQLAGGADLIDEFGNPGDPDDWKFLAGISAYHAAEPGRYYPAILIATNRRDDRVHPGHARKMIAKLQSMGYRAHLIEFAAGGHGYGKDNEDKAMLMSLGYAFLRREIGWDQKASI